MEEDETFREAWAGGRSADGRVLLFSAPPGSIVVRHKSTHQAASDSFAQVEHQISRVPDMTGPICSPNPGPSRLFDWYDHSPRPRRKGLSSVLEIGTGPGRK